MSAKKPSRKQRRQMAHAGVDNETDLFKFNMKMREITPLTDHQKFAFEDWNGGDNLFLHGMAGTGKTFIALYLALKDVMSTKTAHRKVMVVRSAVPTRDMGFLPGTQAEKMAVYEGPYTGICNELFGRGDSYEILKKKGMIEFLPTSNIRGETFSNCIIVIDEMQNMDFGELDTIITRCGRNTRLIFSGDVRQSDFRKKWEISGLPKFIQIIERMEDDFSMIEFDKEDIVRSGLVKAYLIAKNEVDAD